MGDIEKGEVRLRDTFEKKCINSTEVLRAKVKGCLSWILFIPFFENTRSLVMSYANINSFEIPEG